METEELPGARKAAVLLLTMAEEISKEIIKELSDEEIEAIGKEMSQLAFISESMVNKVHEEFGKRLNKRNKTIIGGESKFKMLIKKSLGDEKADAVIETMENKKGMPGEFLRRCDPRLLANVLRGEHPQTIALIFSVLGAKKAGEGIVALPEKMRSDVIIRMAHLAKVDSKVVEEIETVLKEQLETAGASDGRQLGGVEVIAGIFNQMERNLEQDLLGKLEEMDPELADRIRQLMFTFEDLIQLDDKGVQVLLKEVSSEEIAVALKGASDTMKEKIFANMSERASAMLKEDLEAMGPVRLSDVEKAQVKIAMAAKKLEGEGKLILSRGNEKFI